MIALLSLLACNDTLIVDRSDEDEVGADPVEDTAAALEEALDAEWSGSRLVIEEPLSASFLPFKESNDFKATVYNAAGEPTDFADITWASDVDSAWALTGADLSNDSLDVGTHALTAEALLPNGDRLAYTVGGVLVQSIYAGVYTGELQVEAASEYEGQELAVGCAGAMLLVVDAEGETVTGDAGCLLSLLGYEIDTAYLFDLENSDGDLEGTASIDLSFFELPVSTTGSISEDGEIEGSFSADVAGYLAMEASYTATRLTRDLSSVDE